MLSFFLGMVVGLFLRWFLPKMAEKIIYWRRCRHPHRSPAWTDGIVTREECVDCGAYLDRPAMMLDPERIEATKDYRMTQRAVRRTIERFKNEGRP